VLGHLTVAGPSPLRSMNFIKPPSSQCAWINKLKQPSPRLSLWVNLLIGLYTGWCLAHSPPHVNALTIIRLLTLSYNAWVVSYFVQHVIVKTFKSPRAH